MFLGESGEDKKNLKNSVFLLIRHILKRLPTLSKSPMVKKRLVSMAIFRKISHPMQAGEKKQDMRIAELLHSGDGLK